MRYMNLYLSASIPQLETFLTVKKVIDEWDPLHLFPSAPLDEYEYEVFRICQRLDVCPPYRDVPTTEELARFIGYVCCECNHYPRGWETYREIAQKVADALQSSESHACRGQLSLPSVCATI